MCKTKKQFYKYCSNVFVFEQLNTCQNEDSIYSDNWFIYNGVRVIGYNMK